MGLDVYLCHSPNWEETERIAHLEDEISEQVFGNIPEEIEKLRQKERSEWCRSQYAAAAQKHGLSLKDGNYLALDDMSKDILLDSKVYPTHYFKVGYWRSPYNEGGINYALRKLGLPSLYDICGHSCDEYWQKDVNWKEVVEKSQQTLSELQPLSQLGIRVIPGKETFSMNEDISMRKALEQAAKGLQHKSCFEAFSCADGTFFPSGISMVGIVGPWVVIKSDTYEFYVQALEIVRETAKHVLAQPDPQNYRLRWSG